jgi:hypothetical protein
MDPDLMESRLAEINETFRSTARDLPTSMPLLRDALESILDCIRIANEFYLLGIFSSQADDVILRNMGRKPSGRAARLTAMREEFVDGTAGVLAVGARDVVTDLPVLDVALATLRRHVSVKEFRPDADNTIDGLLQDLFSGLPEVRRGLAEIYRFSPDTDDFLRFLCTYAQLRQRAEDHSENLESRVAPLLSDLSIGSLGPLADLFEELTTRPLRGLQALESKAPEATLLDRIALIRETFRRST